MEHGHAPDHGGHGVFGGMPGAFGGGHGHDALGGVGSHGGTHGGHHGANSHVGHIGPHGPGASQIGHDAHMGDGKGRLITSAPLTWLPIGIESGWKYTKETYIHARTFGYQPGVDKCVPRGTCPTALMAEIIAKEAARNHGGGADLSFYQQGFAFAHPAMRSLGQPAPTNDPGRRVNMPGIARNINTIELLAWPHGKCDAKVKLREVMKGLGLVRLDLRRTSSLPDIDKCEHKLLSACPFAGKQDDLNPPNGWFRQNGGEPAKGKTFLWREFYQVPGGFFDRFRNKSGEDMHGTFIAVFGATWYYEATGDYETRIAFSIYGLPYVSTGHETWRWNMLRDNRVAAEKAAAAMLRWISGFSAGATALSKRTKLRPELTEPEAPAPRDPFETQPPVVAPPPAPIEVAGPEPDEVVPPRKKDDDEDDK